MIGSIIGDASVNHIIVCPWVRSLDYCGLHTIIRLSTFNFWWIILHDYIGSITIIVSLAGTTTVYLVACCLALIMGK